MIEIDVARLTTALAKVKDPCSLAMGRPLDIVSMGLVEDIMVDKGSVTVSMVLTDAACVFFRDISRFVEDVLREVPGVEEVDVQISSTTLWSPDRVKQIV